MMLAIFKPNYSHLKAMMKAIDRARIVSDGISNHYYSKADGLRVIKRFEEVNSIDFNPFDSTHLKMISGKASHERFFRKVKTILN